jgi:hypothetical protein
MDANTTFRKSVHFVVFCRVATMTEQRLKEVGRTANGNPVY